jgi:hypothetical protein
MTRATGQATAPGRVEQAAHEVLFGEVDAGHPDSSGRLSVTRRSSNITQHLEARVWRQAVFGAQLVRLLCDHARGHDRTTCGGLNGCIGEPEAFGGDDDAKVHLVADDDVRLPLVTEDQDGTGAFAIACGSLGDPSRAILLLGIGQEQRLPYAGGKQTGPSGVEGREACFLDCVHHCGLTGKGHDVTGDLSGASDRNHRQKVSRPPGKREQDAQRRRPFRAPRPVATPVPAARADASPYIVRPKVCTLDWASVVLPERQLGS